MAVTIDTQNNPIATVGTKEADATVITSGFGAGATSPCHYQIESRDGQLVYNIRSTDTSENIVSADTGTLQIILPLRTNFRVRAKLNKHANFTISPQGEWVNFKTRDKRYQSPDAITQLGTEKSSTSSGETVTVTNTAKATVVSTSRGATVTNTDTGYSNTTSITNTSQGATVVNTS